jgi:hypothetical protein
MTGIEMRRRLSRWTVPFALGIVGGGGCGGTVVQDDRIATGGAAGAVDAPAGSTSFGAGGRFGASAGGSSSTPLGSGGARFGAGGVSLGQGGAGFGGVRPGSGGTMTVVPCGANVCVPPPSPVPGFTASACCADAFTGTCGTTSTLLAGSCEPPTQADPRCPSAQTMFGSYSGCCTNNDCGLDLSSAGLGCVDTANPMISMFLSGVTPLHCDGTPIHVGTGGTGASDAGVVSDASTSDGATGGSGVDASK